MESMVRASLATCILYFQNMAPLCTSGVTFHGAKFAFLRQPSAHPVQTCRNSLHDSIFIRFVRLVDCHSLLFPALLNADSKSNCPHRHQSVTNKGQPWTYRAILRGDPFQASAEKRDAETLATWFFHRSDLLLYVSYGVSISLSHLLVKIFAHNLSLVNFETEGLEILIQFGKTFRRKLRKPKFHQSLFMMTLSATCPGQLLRRSSARCFKMRRKSCELRRPKQRTRCGGGCG